VKTRDHVVYLYGLVASGLESDAAAAIAHQQPGVSEVVNSIALSSDDY
jgi:osmotically-inducible protein OsmY